MPLATKLSLALFTGVMVVVMAFSHARVLREERFFDEDMRRDHRMMALTLRPAVLAVWARDGEARALDVVRSTDADRSGVRLRFVWPFAADTQALLPESSLTPLRSGSEVQVVAALKQLGNGDRLVSYLPLTVPDGRVGALEIAEPLQRKFAYLRTTVVNIAWRTLALTLVCGAIAFAMGRWLVARPVTLLVQKARRAGEGDWSEPLRLRQRDEFAVIAAALNSMCERLAEASERLQNETQARMRALVQLRHADRLSTIGKLASTIAHEIGTPLSVVSGHAQLMERKVLSAEETDESIRTILEQCRRITGIVRQVLDYGRRGAPELRELSPANVVKATVMLLHPLAEKQGVRLEFEVERAAEQVAARADASLLQQVFTNLIMNAVQASRSGQIVSVAIGLASPTAVDASRDRRYFRVRVEDRGAGMSEDTLQHAFEPFFTTKDAGRGAGLGLSIARDIVAEHGGFIEIDSRVGRGSRLDVFLPIAEAT
jgi:two-component system NtrC family sensor kinase